MEKCVILARVSTKEQDETGYSLDAQQKYLEEYATNKFEVTERFRISESASGKTVRKLFYNLLKFVNDNKINIILCEKVDRMTRNPKDAILVSDWLQADEQRQIHFVKESFLASKNNKANENLVWDMKVAIARFYSSNLSEEVKKGRKEKLAQGWLPSQPKLGYKTIGEKGHRIHVVDEVEGPYIKKMFKWYASGNYSLKRLMLSLHDAGFRTKNGFRVSIGNLERLLKDPFYYGVMRWEGKIYPHAKHERLVSKETFDKVQATLHGRNTPKVSKHYYLFKGLFYCSDCNGMVTWERHKGIVYGHCNYRYLKRNCTKKQWSIETDVELELLGYFDRLQLSDKDMAHWLLKALKESHGEEIHYFETTLEKLKTELLRYQHLLDRLYEDKLSEEITKEQYAEKFKRFSAEKDKIAEAISKHSKEGSEYFSLANSIYELGQNGRLIYESANPEEKRELLKLVFGKLQLNGTDVIAEYSAPFTSLATAVQKTNKNNISSENWFDFKIGNIFSELKKTLNQPLDIGKGIALGDAHPIWLSSRVTVTAFKGFLEALRCSVQALGS